MTGYRLTLRAFEQNIWTESRSRSKLVWDYWERESAGLKPLQFIPHGLFTTWLNCHFCSLQNAFVFHEKLLVLKLSITHVAIHFVCALNIDLFTTSKFNHFSDIGNLLPLIPWVWLWDYHKCNLIGPHVWQFQADSIFVTAAHFSCRVDVWKVKSNQNTVGPSGAACCYCLGGTQM